LASLYAQNNLANAQNNLAQSVQRLSSGLRINSAKDDAAGLSISQNMQSQINGTNQSVRNLNDATNLLQVADTSLATIQDMLLRLKQLATQGYDGSLSISQKLNIVQEMKQLDAEINTTAQRTQFNGINLLVSGSTVDRNNSDIRAGVALSTTAVAVDRTTAAKTGIYSTGGASAGTGLADADLGAKLAAVGYASTSTTFSIALDPDLAPRIPGTYTFTSNGNQLTLTGTFDGLAASQTVTVADATANDVAGDLKTTNQILNFDKFGISLNLSSTRAAGDGLLGSTIASQFASTNYKSLIVDGVGSEITDVRLSNVAPATYSLAYNAATDILTMTGLINGNTTTQGVTVSAGVANKTQTLDFSTFGVQIDILSYQTHAADDIGAEIDTLNGGSPSADGELVVSSGNNSALISKVVLIQTFLSKSILSMCRLEQPVLMLVSHAI